MQDCIFCKIAAGELPCHKIWEDENYMAFLSIFPNTDGFAVVIPKQHFDSVPFEDADDDMLAGLTIAAKKTAKKIELAFEDVGRVGLICEGLGVNHFHYKLFPMHGTGDMAEWEVREDKKMTTFFEQYPGYVISNDSHRADDEKLAEFAEKIRGVNG